MAACAGVLNTSWATGFSYAALLLDTGFIWRAMLPPQTLDRVQAEEDSHHNITSPDKVKDWCGWACYG